jgi:two-component system response regulator AtoC
VTDEGTVRRKILVIEDDKVLNNLISEELVGNGYAVARAGSWQESEAYLAREEPDLILLDIRLPDANGMDLVPKLARAYPVIVLTAYGSIKNAVQVMKSGVVHYLSKPIDIEELELEVSRALENADLRRDYEFVKDRQREVSARKSFMVGGSAALKRIITLIDAVASTDTTVLIQGESGVGKELVAREIHQRSARSNGNFVALDCCTLQENLFESELFGYERGAFTGAIAQKRGLIEGANDGTLFLDEIGELSLPMQAKLLRVIETFRFRRLGGVKDLTSHARLVAATNRDLSQMSEKGRFRRDLYYRLSAIVITVPPLRARREDIPALTQYFLANHDFSRRLRKELSADALRTLISYDWPGNVRELRNVMERAVILSGDHRLIHVQHLGLPEAAVAGTQGVEISFDHEPTLEEVKRRYLETLMTKYSGHRGKLASCLGISERNVYRLIEKYGLRELTDTM